MTCPECLAAVADPHHGIYIADCQGCRARALAKSPGFFESRIAGKQTPIYRKALKASGLTHADVLRAAGVSK